MKNRWSAVAFDLDGLLIDSEPFFSEALRRLLAKRQIEFQPAFMQRMMGMPGRDSVPLLRAHYQLNDSIEEIIADYLYHFHEVVGGGMIPLRPGAQSLIENLDEAGVPTAICTSSSRNFVDQMFGPHELLHRFSHVLTCESVSRGKPAPDVYLLAARHFETTPDKLLVFEDSPNGVLAAKAAGCVCVAIPQAHTARNAVAGADLIVNSLDDDDLLNWMQLHITSERMIAEAY